MTEPVPEVADGQLQQDKGNRKGGSYQTHICHCARKGDNLAGKKGHDQPHTHHLDERGSVKAMDDLFSFNSYFASLYRHLEIFPDEILVQ